MSPTAILVIGFGGPRSPEEIRPFLADVLRGKPVPPSRLEEVAKNYEAIGGRSPIVELTERQAGALEAELRRRGVVDPVRVAYRHVSPFVREVLAELAAAGTRRVIALPMAAYEGEASTGRYHDAVAAALEPLGAGAPEVIWARGVRERPGFLAAQVDRVGTALSAVDAASRAAVPLLFTAHSVPVCLAGGYADQIAETARAIAAQLEHPTWRLCWQSRSGAPRDPWLEPDVNDALREEAARGVREVVVAPIGFLCDHVEVLYDLDVRAAQTARELGVRLHRAPTVGEHPQLVAALADVVAAALGR